MEFRRERVAVVLRRQEPRRRPLVHVEMRHLVGEMRHELGRTCPRPDHRHPAPRHGHRVVPGGRVEPGALEFVTPCDRGKGGSVELSGGTHHRVERLRRVRAVTPAQGQLPRLGGLVDAGLGHGAVEADALHQSQRRAHVSQVGQQVGLRREARRPVVGLREREAVELVGHVHPAAGVHVLEPGATDVVVLLEDSHVHAGLTKPVGRGEARGAGPDHGTPERPSGFPQVPRRPPRVGAGQPQLLDEERLPLLGRAVADQEREDRGARRVRQVVVVVVLVLPLGRSRRGVGIPGVRRDATGFVLLFGREASAWDQHLGLVRRQLGTQHREIPGPVRHRAQERMDVCRGEGSVHPRPLGNGRAARRPTLVMCFVLVIPTHRQGA